MGVEIILVSLHTFALCEGRPWSLNGMKKKAQVYSSLDHLFVQVNSVHTNG